MASRLRHTKSARGGTVRSDFCTHMRKAYICSGSERRRRRGGGGGCTGIARVSGKTDKTAAQRCAIVSTRYGSGILINPPIMLTLLPSSLNGPASVACVRAADIGSVTFIGNKRMTEYRRDVSSCQPAADFSIQRTFLGFARHSSIAAFLYSAKREKCRMPEKESLR